jgi:hypothetical protein
MSEEITSKEEEEKVVALPTTKDVEIDVTINGIRYNGIVSIGLDDCHDINLHSLLDDYDLWANYDGTRVCKVCHILAGEALWKAGEGFDTDIEECVETGWHADQEFMRCLESGDWAFEPLCFYFDDWDEWVLYSKTEENRVIDSEGYRYTKRAPSSWFRDRYYCENCDCYIEDDEDYYGEGECRWCHEENEPKIIEGYCESHEHEPILFGDYKDEESFVGLGFELEVDGDSSISKYNEETAQGLCEASGLEEDEMRFAYDGSLNYGFECISQPHTVKSFWEKQAQWREMLRYLADKGYRSHDPGTCGLHVHVSRGMFGKTREIQDTAIAKVYTFFDENWDDIVKVSRRRSFHYCQKNYLDSDDEQKVIDKRTTRFECWKKASKWQGGHGVALNNSNSATFEYRLGRGTLNAWSFFSWIDFVITITKNAKRITVGKVESNDKLSWLGGISESTAKYIYKRGAFQKEMLALYPNIEWEQDLIDNNN